MHSCWMRRSDGGRGRCRSRGPGRQHRHQRHSSASHAASISAARSPGPAVVVRDRPRKSGPRPSRAAISDCSLWLPPSSPAIPPFFWNISQETTAAFDPPAYRRRGPEPDTADGRGRAKLPGHRVETSAALQQKPPVSPTCEHERPRSGPGPPVHWPLGRGPTMDTRPVESESHFAPATVSNGHRPRLAKSVLPAACCAPVPWDNPASVEP